jgi:hypothetical protein
MTFGDPAATLTTDGGNGDGNVTYSVGTSTGCEVNNVDKLTVTNASGTCSVTATKAEDNNYLSKTSEAKTVQLNKAQATVQLSNLGPYIWDGTAKSASATTSNPSGLSVQITYSKNGSSVANPTDVGSYDVLAKIDNNNYQGQATGTLTISAWKLNGFFAPVDYDTATTKVWNTVKGGATVPLKFEIFKGTTESSNTADVDKFIATPITCPNGTLTTDEIEILSTGGTQLRYDTTAGQFIQNWQTPKKPGACYDVTMQTDDGTKLRIAHFQLK